MQEVLPMNREQTEYEWTELLFYLGQDQLFYFLTKFLFPSDEVP